MGLIHSNGEGKGMIAGVVNPDRGIHLSAEAWGALHASQAVCPLIWECAGMCDWMVR